ncbi:UPF0182 family protein [Actinosynnema sp. NPDC047251]|uniref:UPF0182 protein BN6_10220 n=1 Tax=Saccharothrix espanaensis (strain ATCC 51144 / DSM 44229 / JCM 9112 / NBRC 15066 / NRRL 15764) TaxID=1179773 RepID=K0JP79_SACES|nr:UPF0182 family protein [Saccharothrix espanaensis]CCH28350.1 hypothetical protein BN6_10220 [Saccharothrix espanaensis DSM 44229]
MATRPPVGLPRLSRRSRILLIVGAVVLVGLITGSRLLGTYVNWLWFGEVGFRSVYGIELATRFGLFFAVGLLVGGLVALNLILAYRSRPVFVPVSGPDDPVARYRSVVTRRMKLFAIGLPVIVGVIAGGSAQGDWQKIQLFFNATMFNETDAEFGHDIGFYAFQLPFYTWLLSWLFIATAVSFVGAVVAHYLFGGIRLAGRGGQLSGPARTHLSIVAGVFVLLKAVAYFFDRYQLLFSDRNEKFTGATYTDLNAVLPAKLILLCIAVFCAIAFFTGAVLRNLQLPAIATVLLVLSSILVGAAWPAVLEQFSVRPNAIEKEADSIGRNIAATKEAFGLTDDKVETKPYEGKQNVSLDELKNDQATLGNIRLLDPAVISKTFTQFQQLRPFYAFPEKLDVDRYKVDSQLQDYIVAVRELNTAGIPQGQRDWINQHLIYTHGNGMVFAEASKINSPADQGGNGGYPVFEVAEVDQEGKVKPGPFGVQQPRTYFGELGSDADYAIVGGRDGGSPGEYDTDRSQYTYDGKGGVRIGGLFNKLVFAAAYGERNILFNSAIGEDSRIIFNRHPRERVEKVAPWLTVDGDPYPAVVDGKITWIVDGYTTLENYPYARRTSLASATNDSLPGVAQQPNKDVSYIRNSVKATVDAYDGSVTLYAMDEKDPVLRAWMGVFPGTVKANSDMSQSLREHLRYPEDLFKVQRETLARYHVDQPRDFYSGVSFWGVPSDPTIDNVTTAEQQQQNSQQPRDQQPPFYVLAGDPTGDPNKVSFQLTSALVRQNREFMASYVSVRSDPDNYGKISVLTLNNEAKGPQQIQTQFLTSGEVSSELNLLTQRQTKVVYGNLLTLPVGGGLLYVEPIYIERASQNTQFPQLYKVLVSFGDKVGYAPTLKEALEKVLSGSSAQLPDQNGETPGGTTTPPTSTTPPGSSNGQTTELQQAVKDIQSALAAIKAAQGSGDFAALGNAYKALDEATKKFETASAAAPQTSQSSVAPSPTPTG